MPSSSTTLYETILLMSSTGIYNLTWGVQMVLIGCFWCPCRRLLGFSINEQSIVTLTQTGQYLAGCNGCTQYATGKSNLSNRNVGGDESSRRMSFAEFLFFVHYYRWWVREEVSAYTVTT